jgi:integrase
LRTKTNRVLHRSHRWSKAEPLGLTWGRLDPSRGVVTKSGRLREVPMRQAIYDRLVALPGPREGRLWAGPEDAAGLEDFRFHDCRHHVASWFMMRGGSLQALKERLGHRDIRPLIHVHLSPSYLRAEVAKTERPAPVPTDEGISARPIRTKSAQSSSVTVESEERVR